MDSPVTGGAVERGIAFCNLRGNPTSTSQFITDWGFSWHLQISSHLQSPAPFHRNSSLNDGHIISSLIEGHTNFQVTHLNPLDSENRDSVMTFKGHILVLFKRGKNLMLLSLEAQASRYFQSKCALPFFKEVSLSDRRIQWLIAQLFFMLSCGIGCRGMHCFRCSCTLGIRCRPFGVGGQSLINTQS